MNYFGIDCGTTNWRFFQCNLSSSSTQPQPVSLTICDPTRHSLLASLLLDADNQVLACGERAYEEMNNAKSDQKLVYGFKPCFGNNQDIVQSDINKRYSHNEASIWTSKLLFKVLERLQIEKPNSLTKNNQFIFTHPVHWGTMNGNDEITGEILNNFALTIRNNFPDNFQENIQFLPEPEAAILSLLQTKQLEEMPNGYTLIIDIGGGTTDLVAGQFTVEGLKDIRSSGAGYGGNHFDQVIAKYIATQFNLDEFEQSLSDGQLQYYGRKFKESLSQQARINYNQPVNLSVMLFFSTENNVLRQQISLTCDEFEQIVTDGKNYLQQSFLESLEKMELNSETVSQIILVGGGARLFIVPNILREIFGTSVRIMYADPPESAIARGATLWGIRKELLNRSLPENKEPKITKEENEYAKIARENLRQGKYEMAIENFSKIIQENPTDMPAYFNRGQAYYQKGNIQSAINDWSQVVNMNPNDAYASYKLGEGFLKHEDYKAAIMNFDQALSLNPQLADAYLGKGIAHYYLGQIEQAKNNFNQVVHISPGILENHLKQLRKPLIDIIPIANNKKRLRQELIQILESILECKQPKTKTSIENLVTFIQTKLPQEPEVFPVITHKEVVEYFVNERPSFPITNKGAILRQKYPKKLDLFVVYQIFLDEHNELVCQPNGIPFGRKVLVRNFDEQMLEFFQDKDLIIFE